ncbi:TonB-dependent receptor domain-containing protein [Caenispirillum bisanense]|uniref:TonB-dependent receptor domain-containing protein n=1 Tax=Caenispirillum bisanense TaxID=414052 RepID=UPI0031DE2852
MAATTGGLRARLAGGLAAAALLGLPAGAVQAQDQAEPPAEAGGEAVMLKQMVVSASAAETDLRDAPASISVISRQDIEKRPVSDINEVLRTVPGVNMQFGSDGTRGVSIRGLGSSYTLILIDGKRVDGGLTTFRHYRGDTNWVPVEGIERIEVVRGPMSTLYGSDALGGVVNIITRKGGDTWSGSVTAETIVQQDDDHGDTGKVTFYTAGPLIPDRMALRVYGGYSRTGSDSAAIANPREGTRNRDLSGDLSIALTEAQTVDLGLSYGEQDYLALDGVENSNPTTMTRLGASIGHTGAWDFGTSTVRAYVEKAKNEHTITNAAGLTLGDGIEATSYTVDGKLSLPLDLVVPQTVNIGGEARYQELDDPENTGKFNTLLGITGPSTADVTTYALFVEDTAYVTDAFSVTAGVRMDHHEKFGEHFSPRLYGVYHITDAVTVKGGYAEAFKAPDLRELNPYWVTTSRGRGCGAVGGPCEMVGNPDLQPETSKSKEVGLYYDHDGWAANVTYFHNDIENLITSARTASLILPNGTKYVQRINVDKARTSGIEGGVTVPLHDTLSWTTSFTYMIEAKNLTTGMPLSSSPELSVNTDLTWQARDDLRVTLTAQYMGEQVDYVASPETLIAQSVDPYTTVSLSAAYDLTDSLTLRGGVLNVFDETPEGEGYNYREDGRAFFASITATF